MARERELQLLPQEEARALKQSFSVLTTVTVWGIHLVLLVRSTVRPHITNLRVREWGWGIG